MSEPTAPDSTYRALGFRFRLDGALAPRLSPLFHGMLDIGDDAVAPAGPVSILTVEDNDAHGSLAVSIDGDIVFRTVDLGAAVHQTVWEITQRAIATRQCHVILHAGAVAVDDNVILISGPSGAGKSTLVDALMQNGARYLTDEAVEIDSSGSVVDAVARPIHLSKHSLELLGRAIPPDAVEMPGGGAYLPSHAAGGVGTFRDPIIVLISGRNPIGAASEPRRSSIVASLVRESFPPAAVTQEGLDAVKNLTMQARSLTLSGGSVAWRATLVKSFSERPQMIV